MNKMVITIGRQYGSGGREIGEYLSKKLGIKLYDKELITIAAKESGMCEEFFAKHDETPNRSFLYSLVMDTYTTNFSSNAYTDMPMNHKIFLEQFNAIKKIANEESCILIGRCSDYALEEHEHCINIFIHADEDSRVKRIARRREVDLTKAKDLMVKTDKKRASYYNYFSNKKWGEAKTYHLTVDSTTLGIEGTADVILNYVNNIREAGKKEI